MWWPFELLSLTDDRRYIAISFISPGTGIEPRKGEENAHACDNACGC